MLYNVYCDESCHLKNDNSDVMILGSLVCPDSKKKKVSNDIRNIKIKHNINSKIEAKWTKVSRSKIDMFIELIQYFFNNEDLCFRALVAKNKNKLNHNKYNNNDYDLWYYKMYYLLLDKICYPHFKYKIFIDIKDTRGGVRVKKLHEVLCNNRYDFMQDSIRDIQQINSNRSDLLQITDLLIGALSFYYRDLYNDVNKSVYKKQVVNTLISNVGKSSIDNGTNLTEKKFNIFIWEPRVV